MCNKNQPEILIVNKLYPTISSDTTTQGFTEFNPIQKETEIGQNACINPEMQVHIIHLTTEVRVPYNGAKVSSAKYVTKFIWF